MKPYEVTLFILSIVLSILSICLVFGGHEFTLRIPDISSWFIRDSLPTTEPDTIAFHDSIPSVQPSQQGQPIQSNSSIPSSQPSQSSQPSKPSPSIPQAASAVGDTLSLPHFNHGLQNAANRPVRIVHYGDSQIEEDRISMVLRHSLQAVYGGGGVGLLPLVQTIPTYTCRQRIYRDGVELPRTAVTRHLAYGPASMRLRNSTAYGPMAQVATIDEPLTATFELNSDKIETFPFTAVRVLCDSTVYWTADTTAGRAVSIQFTGSGEVYGVSLETPVGVMVDNIPMRGAAGTVFTSISRRQLEHYYQSTGVALIIMQYGGNAMPAIRSQRAVTAYVESMRSHVRYVHSCAPDADILFIGPSDMITTDDGNRVSYPMLPYMDRELRAMVEQEGCEYWSLFHAMGGAGSMNQWHDKGLAGDDLIHFSRSGAMKVGRMLSDAIMQSKQ